MLFWFSTFNEIITEDKLLAVIGNRVPHIATLLTMIFRFVPKYIRQGKAVMQANRALGANTNGLKNKIKTQAEVFSVTTTWALENSVDTVDSMKARGYGIGKRSSYNNYRIEIRDIVVIVIMIFLMMFIYIAQVRGDVFTYYYPVVRIKGTAPVYIMHFALCMLPIIINLLEALRWHRLRSKI